ncbi:MAG TPA: Tellurium resistance protein TerA [Alphaproteobacteria bacterium]|nr:Tellurium resistance protein TerA [Alphaproteobacteria bacterium]HNS45064.1 Tellurium resistance protein TerA [Alphaproteobacteria bacterium]
MAQDDNTGGSLNSLMEATRVRSQFSGHRGSLGAAGYIDPNDQDINADFLGRRNDTLSISPPPEGFGDVRIGAAWDNQTQPDTSFLGKLFKKSKPVDIDLDLGILYELKDGSRGAVQAFGDLMGHYNEPPYLSLSGDERTGDAEGDDEYAHLNGKHWPDFKRILVYVYIYQGALDWAMVRPQIHIRVPGQKPMIVTLSSHHKGLGLCAIAGIENIRDGMVVTNYTEYFPGHAEMDRAFGFGIEWEEGFKSA